MIEPKKLFRFYGKHQYFVESIKENYLRIPCVTEFNDPFDSAMYILNDDIQNISNFEETEKALLKDRGDYFAACFFADDENNEAIKNLYMWGHYADGHRGIAVEYDIEYLRKSVQKQYTNQELNLIKMDYECKNQPKLTEIDLISMGHGIVEPIEEYFLKLLRYKTPNWQHENEYRFVILYKNAKKNYIKIALLKNAVKNVYLGLRCKDEVEKYQETLTAIRKSYPNVGIYDAKKIPGKLDIEFKKIPK